MSIRQLKSGERIPDAPARRYLNRSNGYVRLRWTVAPRTQVEVYEHRVDPDGVVVDGVVHHDDRNRANNSPDNLHVHSDAASHMKEHRTDDERIAALYQEGLTTTEISARLGVRASTAYRSLVRQGEKIRPVKDQLKKNLPTDEICSRYSAGESLAKLATAFEVSTGAIQRRLAEGGVTARKCGRPKKE